MSACRSIIHRYGRKSLLYFKLKRLNIIHIMQAPAQPHLNINFDNPSSKAIQQPQPQPGPPKQQNFINGNGFFSRIFFIWPFKLLSLATIEDLKVTDLPDLPSHLKAESLFQDYKSNLREYSQMGLLKMLMKIFGCELLKLVFLCTLVQVFYCSYPILIYFNIDYLQNHKNNLNYGIMLFSMTIICSFLYNLSYTSLKYLFRSLGVKVSTHLNLLIYYKSLKYSLSSNKKFSENDIINYSQIDTDNMMRIGSKVSYFIFGLLEIVAGFGLLYWFVGFAFVAGLIVLVVISAVTFTISSCSVNLGDEALSKKDERLSATEQLLNIIRYIKQNAYEKIYYTKIKTWREKELKIYNTKGVIEAVTIFLYYLTTPAILTSLILTYIYIHGEMTPSTVFSTMMIAVIFEVTSQQFPKAISQLIAIINSIKRIDQFLSAPEIDSKKYSRHQGKRDSRYSISIKDGQFYIKSKSLIEIRQKTQKRISSKKIINQPQTLKNLHSSVIINDSVGVIQQNANSEESQSDNVIVLKNINLNIEKGKLYMIFGDIGSGKSSLLLSILNEFNQQKKSEVEVNGKIAYVSQKPWIFSGTLQANIQFLHEKDQKRLHDAIKYACLEDDMQLFSDGINTQIGQNGINLSGGQKFRVDLARSLYSDSDIYLFDDIISAVDIHVATYIMQQAVQNYLHDKTIIMATHAIKFAQMADYIILLHKGQVVACQTYAQIKKYPEFREIQTKILEKEQGQQDVKKKKLEEKEIIKLVIQQSSYCEEPAAKKPGQQHNEDGKHIQALILPEDKEKGEVNFNMFKEYIKYNGGYICFLLPVLFCLISYTAIQTTASIIISKWSDTNGTQSSYLWIFIGLTLSANIFIFFQALILTFSAVRQGKKVHNNIIKGLLYANLIKFFNRVPLGRIMSRLSKDLKQLDEVISSTFCSSLTCGFKILAAIFISVYTSTPYAIIPVVFVFIVFMKLRKVYITAQNQLIRLEKTTNSPLVIGFSNGIRGAALIRSYKCQEKFLNAYIESVNNYKRVLYNRYALAGWFILVLVYLTYVINMFSIGFCMFGATMNPSYIGLLLTYVLNFNDQLFQFVLDQTDFETQLISLQRLYKLMNLPTEEKYTKYCEQWNEAEEEEVDILKSGKIQFKNVSVRYRKELDKVLNGLQLVIKDGEKVGVVGRTGSGKSTILNTLLQFTEICEGEILFDDIPLTQIPLKTLRKAITVIDQEPILLNSTFRQNLDMFNNYSDQQLQKVMHECNIFDIVASKGGIDGKVCNSSLSAGEKQLICICRAVLRKARIILIDEATANIDVKNDALIQKVISEKFTGKTVLMIAHRISSLTNYDKIVVMESGKIIECGSPASLLQQKGVYYEIVTKAAKRL